MNNIICVAGPTASGKTKLAVELARTFHGEVISCDSMQIYRQMDIGTAKPTPAEMGEIPHHMLDVAAPEEDFSVGKFVAMADPILQNILARGKRAILCGGTGLYMDSLLLGRSFAPMPTTGRREELEEMAHTQGIEAVQALLASFDPESAARLHSSDSRRIIRAAEVYLETGKTITRHNWETQQLPPKYTAKWIGLNFANRQDLYDRINLRVDLMVQEGLLQELTDLLAMGLPKTATSLQAIGYKELVSAMDGFETMEEALDRLRQNSRRYAKRQLTWLRKNPEIFWIDQKSPVDFSEIFQRAAAYLRSFDGPI